MAWQKRNTYLHLVATERELAREGMIRDIPQMFVNHESDLLFTVLIALLCWFILGTAGNLNTLLVIHLITSFYFKSLQPDDILAFS